MEYSCEDDTLRATESTTEAADEFRFGVASNRLSKPRFIPSDESRLELRQALRPGGLRSLTMAAARVDRLVTLAIPY